MRERDYAGLVEVVSRAVRADWPDVTARAARRNRLRRAFGALAAAVVLGAGGSVLVTSGGDERPSPPPLPPRVVVSPDRSTVLTGDLDRFYAVADDCRDDPACRAGLAVSTDRGVTWAVRPVPATAANGTFRLVAASGRTVLALQSLGAAEPVWWASTDEGATWHRSREIRRDAVPDDWPVFRTIEELGAFDPRTGDRVPFRVPGWAYRSVGPPGGGRWLVTFSEQRDVSLAKARPGGDWSTTRLPFDAAEFCDLVTPDGRLVYALTSDTIRTLDLHVSRDGGRTWRRTATLSDPLPSRSTLLLTADGTLYLASQLRLYRSTDGGRTFTALDPAAPRKETVLTAVPGGGYTISNRLPSPQVSWSTDGRTWTSVRPAF
ncbi:sialidase family protein [Asanoa siamensis]|uniref:Exo-alpha-sialidase n=1 Tax=Asanoa siamensis TaxID=926357 RepID=A0ABQ4CTS7_9ACTN|nr:sialidase family protein [Asanoa siamensis]GIF74408.1 hypothetical protein Asi02nite_39260 [Asanoa siamensis]